MRMQWGKKKRKTGLKLILLVVLVMFGIINVSKGKAEKEERELIAKKQALEESSKREDERKLELTEEAAYRETLEYTEKIARDKLGLVMPDDIILHQEDETE